MKSLNMLTILLPFILMTSSCDLLKIDDKSNESKDFVRRELPRALDISEKQLIDGSTRFGIELMQQIAGIDPESNHFISPLSIVLAAGMLLNGAEGETYEQIQEMLGLDGMDQQEINEAGQSLIELLAGFDNKVVFNIANSVWYRNTFEVETDFLQANQYYFDALVQKVDFNDPATVDLINEWVEDKTEGLINEIVQDIDPLVMMFLINAIYFNGEWTLQFDPDLTDKKPFFLSDGTESEVDMMRLEDAENLEYATGENWQAVNLYYGDAGFAMTLVLPDENISLYEWFREMDLEIWSAFTRRFINVTLDLEMPKFELEYEVDLNDLLEEMGMVDAFYPDRSDFSRINSDYEDLHVSDVLHKSFVRVDEEGTEAAAVTSIGFRATSVPQRVHIRFDRPYFYVIREVESNTPLFMGMMSNPAGE